MVLPATAAPLKTSSRQDRSLQEDSRALGGLSHGHLDCCRARARPLPRAVGSVLHLLHPSREGPRPHVVHVVEAARSPRHWPRRWVPTDSAGRRRRSWLSLLKGLRREPLTFNGLANTHGYRLREHRPIPRECVEFAVLRADDIVRRPCGIETQRSSCGSAGLSHPLAPSDRQREHAAAEQHKRGRFGNRRVRSGKIIEREIT